jgi:cyanophycin synthetase
VQIYSLQSFTGRNIFSHKPVIKIILNIGDLHRTPTKDIEGFNESLLNLFPGLGKHKCSLGYEGGFLQRLNEGTYIGHVTEHLIIELQNLSGCSVAFGKTRVISEPSIYYIVYEYMNERVGIECGKAAVNIIESLAGNRNIDVRKILDELKRVKVESDLGPSTKAIYEEALKRGIPVSRLGNGSLLQLGLGKRSRLIEASLTDKTSCIAADLASNKHLTKKILEDNNISVPRGEIAYTEESAVAIAEDIGYPVVLKPIDGNQGKGVILNILDEAEVRNAYKESVKYSSVILVEKFIKGNDYRILVVGNKVSAVSQRKPPFVTGDGIHTIKELVDLENSTPLRGADHEKPLTRIKLDKTALLVLKRAGLNEEYIPKKGEPVVLRDNGNISTGGTARDCTDEIHPYNSYIALKVSNLLGLDIAGIDMTIEDISIPLCSKTGAVIEVNAAPGLRMHLYPSEGKSKNVASDIVDMLFPKDMPVSIPIVSITGTNGKTTTTRLVSHTLSFQGRKVGMTSTSGTYLGGECIQKGDNSGPISAKLILSNKEAEAAVLETARGGIVRKGLGYDLADVGVIVNISDDHIGLDGLNNLEDLGFVKSLVIEAVKPDGYAVLNADDGMLEYLLKRVRSKLILFSKDANNHKLKEHVKKGGKAVYIDNNTIYVCNGIFKTPLLGVAEIPITFGGLVGCNIENSLAAVSALIGLDIPLSIINKGLRSFMPDIRLNPGRFNLFDMGYFKVMLDYSHNTAGYKAVIDFIRKTEAKGLVGIIGMPGDRLDRNISEVGELCAKVFSKVYIKEDDDLRGRDPGEVAGILFDAIIRNGGKKENVEIVYSELKALETAMLEAKPGDLIIMFYEEFERAVELVNRFKQEIDEGILNSEEQGQETAG